MEQNTLESNSCDRRCVCFGKAIIAGIIATVFLQVIMYLQGHNASFDLGKMILGAEAIPAYIYLAGIAFSLLVGIIFAIFYAWILAPMYFIPDFLQAIIFAVIITAISIFAFPKLQPIFDTITSKHSEVQTNPQLTADLEKSPDLANKESALTTTVEDSDQNSTAKKQMLLASFINHLIFAFSVILIYRCRRKKEILIVKRDFKNDV